MKIKRTIVLFVLALTSWYGYGQDIHFSQFSETPLLRNPALAGIFSGDLRIQGVNKSQWSSVTVPFQTSSINAEYKMPVGKGDDFLSLAAEVVYDKAGTVALTTTEVLPALNYNKSLSASRNMYLSLGFMGGFVQRRIDRSKITTNSQYDGSGYVPGSSNGETFSGNGYSYMDGSVGMSLNSELGDKPDDNFYVGVAYHHFNKASKISFYGNDMVALQPKWVLSAGLRSGLNDYSYVTFYADYTKQNPNTEVMAGALYTYKLDDDVDNAKYMIEAGSYIRWGDAVIPVAKLYFLPYSIAISYDVNISKLTTASQARGGFEVSLVYQRSFQRYNSARDGTRCPRF